jgi:plastocyanin
MRRAALVTALAAALAALAAACGGGEADPASSPATPASSGTETGGATTTAPEGRAEGADPRDGGFEVALGEWAVTPEAKAIRPGHATFVIVNRGTMPHGFEIEREDVDDDASKVETRILQPGESVEVELDLEAGIYKLECNVEGHDDMGMEMLLEVSPDAPLAAKPATGKEQKATVSIEAFAFTPATVEVATGQEVVWKNHDPADHTVAGQNDEFDSGTVRQGGTFRTSFDSPGEYRYICALHPGMKGTVVVAG